MPPLRSPPPWWDWELELSVHVEQRMLERGITEVELRAMVERTREIEPSHVEGRFVAKTRHEGTDWAVVLEPDAERQCIAVVTVYNREEP